MRLAAWAALLAAGGVATALGIGNDDGEVTVTSPVATAGATASAPKETRVKLKMEDGSTWSCPPSTESRLDPYRQRMGKGELDLRSVRKSIKRRTSRLAALDKQYPGDAPTQAIADTYNAVVTEVKNLDKRETRLVRTYNRAADAHNAAIEDDCTQ